MDSIISTAKQCDAINRVPTAKLELYPNDNMQLPKFWIAGRTCSIHSIQATIITGVYSDTAAKHRSNKCWAQFASHDFRGPRWSAEGRGASYSLTLLINPATNQNSRTHASSSNEYARLIGSPCNQCGVLSSLRRALCENKAKEE